MEFVTVINRKKCKKIYKAIRKPIILFLLYFEIFFALFCCTVLFYPDKDYGMISFMVITTLFFIWLYVMYRKKNIDQMCPKEVKNKNGEYIQKVKFEEDEIVVWSLSLIHISEPTRRVVISYAVFCLKKIFFNDTATTEIYTRLFVGSVRCV